jgi:hypothetical protein
MVEKQSGSSRMSSVVFVIICYQYCSYYSFPFQKFIMKYLKLFLLTLLIGCNSSENEPVLFEKIESSFSGLDFINKIEETEDANYFKYMYMYIGGGVACADFDKDGLEDLFIISNSFNSKLYKNLGDFKFEDITESSNIVKRPGFDVGAAVADVNKDGWLDIYITRGGWKDENGGFENMLYINNGISKLPNGKTGVTFTERAKEFNLADANRGIAATFFDYDQDGDIDLFLSNTPDFESKGNVVLDLDKVALDLKTPLQKGMDKLYRNDGNNHFLDVSLAAGIKPDIGFGLSPQVGDVNNDGWMDIYVCNDFRIPDFLYINNQDGTFTDKRNESLKHMSFNSMGSDIADINNDGLMDIFTLDMNPEDYIRSSTTMGSTSQYLFELMVEKNHHRQYMHNMLQLNNGNGTFSEIANMAGVANTDWSWACLMADFDLDGNNDIFVSNGVFRDVIDRDVNDEILKTLQARGRKPTDADFLEFAKKLPQQKLNNYFFKNNGDLTFTDKSSKWINQQPTFSNGATYADLDNDGDLDLVISNINDELDILKNKSIELGLGSFVKLNLEGPPTNLTGIGTTVKLYLDSDEILSRQLLTTRGFLSAVSATLHFGLKKASKIIKTEVIWPNGMIQEVDKIELNSLNTIKYNAATVKPYQSEKNIADEVFTQIPFDFRHQEIPFDDFKIQALIPQKYSQLGPALAVADVNGDGLEDFYIGGGLKQAGRLYIGKSTGGFQLSKQPEIEANSPTEDTDAVFFDVDGDKDMDLIVLTGSSENDLANFGVMHHLFINDGKGNLKQDFDKLPKIDGIGSVVKISDFDRDGDQDIFIGNRMVPGYYPLSPSSHLLINNQGLYEDFTAYIAPQLERVGMVTDAQWADIDNDNDIDLIVCGEWMGITVFENNDNIFTISEAFMSLKKHTGWWNKILIEDVDDDGDNDIIAGNFGLNSKYKATEDFPLIIYGNDFDNNGQVDPILTTWYGKKQVPIRGRAAFIQQMPVLGNKSTTFKGFANKSIQELLGEAIENALKLEASDLRSGMFINNGNNNFEFHAFAPIVQSTLINSILFEDFDGDGHKDLLLAGNNYLIENETTRMDAGNGVYLKGDGKGKFSYVPNYLHNFWTQGDVRKLLTVKNGKNSFVLVANNNDFLQLYSYK